ncbi:DNA glycosylase AlkZ-like family protein [Hyalangium rubrum]|uniref:Crosslink repair DNA glycosylase YcaQ family protein n=1 Tax=Hyalangium rubrum TaxID=3103134 RepID=A0ABU5HE70_9BACT|nr:crosslink repair DNA glycosylase YcaQ family protein [Hyalangium sp. s54d21]MDY7231570.1 crosslink repair DNA glycosylase YcaQ family protein [Hyalangium sp. s54d21]
MARSTPALTLTLDRARGHWHRRQGLAEPGKGSLEEIVASTSWPRTLGGVDVYLAVRARLPSLRRQDLDEAVAQSRLQVIPAVRGCIYLVPRAQVPLVLRFAEDQSRKRIEKEMEKVGVPQKELADVGEAVIKALRKGPLTTDALRKALPEGVVRSLGEKGKKVGISSTLPPALRHLEFEGKVERTLDTGRLDTERYHWRLPAKNPFTGAKVPSDVAERNARLAEIFLRQTGPVAVASFAAWSGLSQRDARAAMERLPVVPVVVEGYDDEAFVLEQDVAVLKEAVPAATSISLLSFEDNYLTFHGGPGLLTELKHHGVKVTKWGNTKGTTLGDVKHVSARTLFDGDKLVGFWEFDPSSGTVAFSTFDPLPPKRKRAVQEQAQSVATFLKDDVGHARSFSLDTMEAVQERADLIKKM